jgi:hypothetical protein
VSSEIAREPHEDDEVDKNTLEDIDGSIDSVSEEWDMVDHEEAAPALVSIVEGDRRRSTFSFTVVEAPKEAAQQDAPEAIQITENDAPATPEADTLRPEEIPLPESSPLKATSPTKFNHDPTPGELDVSITASYDTPSELTKAEELGSTDNADLNEYNDSALEDEDSINDTITQKDVVKLEDQVSEQDKPAVDVNEETQDHAEMELEIPVTNGGVAELDQPEDADMSGFSLDLGLFSPQKQDISNEVDFEDQVDSLQETEELTEASLQLEAQQAMEIEESTAEIDDADSPHEQINTTEDNVTVDGNQVEAIVEPIEAEDEQVHPSTMSDASTSETPKTFTSLDDIADGLTLTPSVSASRRESTASKLRSPSPPPRPEYGPDEVTATMHLDDTALLKDFLTRAAASKADKVANISRRTSLQARRDSDAVRQALASPRKVLEDKDPNSPSKYDADATLDLSQTLTLNMEQQALSPTPGQPDVESTEEGKPSKSSRRSTRTRKSRLPAPASAVAPPPQTPKNISIRRGEGDPIVLKKTETQELALITRTNTRKNKQGAVAVNLRLLKLANEAANSSDDSTMSVAEAQAGKKNVRWDETLAYFQEGTDTLANMLADTESLSTPDELSASISTPSIKKKSRQPKEKSEKSEAPKVRRVRGLGAANGTPGKGLLAPASMLPDGVAEEKEAAPEKPQRLPKASKLKKLVVASGSADSVSSPKPSAPLPPLEIAPVGVDTATTAKAAKERKSKLASPRKVKLPQPTSAASNALGEGKENQQKSRGIGGATPKKGLKLPEVIVPPVVESGLPRRRAGRKL